MSGAASAELYSPIGAYAIVGDCHTAALVSRDGSVDWYCPGRFDAPAVFCRLLDAKRGGSLRLAPREAYSATRRYRGATNVLETIFSAPGGRVRVTDLMPIYARKPTRAGYDVGTANRLLRCVEGLAGEVELELLFDPTFDYARAATQLTPAPGVGAVAQAGDKHLTLACPDVPWSPAGPRGMRGRLRVRAGQRLWVGLTYGEGPGARPQALQSGECEEQLAQTLKYWEQWAAYCTYQGPYRQEVLRSTLVLKLLDHEPTGAIIAAPTTSLPEEIGGERNWDYRYAWLRDSALMLYALTAVGYPEEAHDFFGWLDRVSGPDVAPVPQIMYGVCGEQDLHEQTLDHLEGYRGSRPVRLGNGAASQKQLDIFGEVLRAAYVYHRQDIQRRGEGELAVPTPGDGPTSTVWALLHWLVEQAAARWAEPDHGIWEVRGGPRHFLNSKLMCWAALDRGIRLAEEYRREAPLRSWRRQRDAIRAAILEHGYNDRRAAFTQAFGSPALDAAALRIPLIGFLPATDPRVQATIERIRADLTRNGLVYRYRVEETEDGLRGGEGTFALCSFWLVDALALGGHLEAAYELFERLVQYANDVGLLSEEIDPHSGELLGNFPQGFTHLALINSAVNLAKAAKHGPETAPENEAERGSRAGSAAAEDHPTRPR